MLILNRKEISIFKSSSQIRFTDFGSRFTRRYYGGLIRRLSGGLSRRFYGGLF
jgi:phage baseplate assembly protein W